MSAHLQVDLKVIEVHAPTVARACEVSVLHVIGGLNLLWHRCWSLKTDTVTKVGLAGIFGPQGLERLTEALVDAGLLAPQGDAWRVRGADKYLRLAEARSKGGHASKGNLLPGGNKPPSVSREPAEVQPSEQPRLELGSRSALTPNTDTPITDTPNTEKQQAPPKKPAPPRESDALVADFQAIVGAKYLWQGAKDGVALAALRKNHSLEEVRARWRKGLAASGWASCRTVAQLAAKWNDLAGTAPANGRSPVPAESVDWSTVQAGEIAP